MLILCNNDKDALFMTIELLPKNVVALMAAGEVIHRPSDVIKELVENAIDAQASVIKIDLMQGGIEKISVLDNGSGIDKEQLKLAIEPHATSKLAQIDDLQSVSTYGFRGEALFSISQVSNFTLSSKTAQMDIGHQIVRRSPDWTVSSQPKAMPNGTCVEAHQLFAPYPVRRKFLKSPRIELQRSSVPIIALAMAYYKVQFSLWHNMKQEWLFKSVSSKIERLEQVFKQTKGLWSHHIKSFDKGQINLYYCEKSTKGLEQWWFFNKRMIIDNSYKRLMQQYLSVGKVCIDIEILPEYIDPNLHPQKLIIGLSFHEGFIASLQDFMQEVFPQPLKTSADDYSAAPVFEQAQNIGRQPLRAQSQESSVTSAVGKLDEPQYNESHNQYREFKLPQQSAIGIGPIEKPREALPHLWVSEQHALFNLRQEVFVVDVSCLILKWLERQVVTKPLLIPFPVRKPNIRQDLIKIGCKFFEEKLTHIHPMINCVALERALAEQGDIEKELTWARLVKESFFELWSESTLRDFILKASVPYQIVQIPITQSSCNREFANEN